MIIISAWSPVVRGTNIPFDLESTPLQIKTDSAAGSGEKITLFVHNAEESYIGHVMVEFSSPLKYFIADCTSWTSNPVPPPEEVDKIWTIQKKPTTFSIDCNGVEVLNYKFSDSNDTDCVSRWGKDVENIVFPIPWDTASDSYRGKPGKEGS
eukprot:sb/3473438/